MCTIYWVCALQLLLGVRVGSSVASDPVTEAPRPNLNPELVNELRDFAYLIPTATVEELVAKHYVFDHEFRHAADYVRSTQFPVLMQRLLDIPEVVRILDFLHMTAEQQRTLRPSGEQVQEEQPSAVSNDIYEWDALQSAPLLDFVLLDAKSRKRRVGSLTAFVEELIAKLPRTAYVQMIDEKRQRSGAFATFYTALRNEQLRSMVQNTLKSTNLADVLQLLSAHSIDVWSLEPLAFRVISWGPDLAPPPPPPAQRSN